MPAPFAATYPRFSPEVVALLGRISLALGTVRGARVLPAVADQLRATAKAGTVHYSNLIEGNELPYVEAERASRGELQGDTRAKLELVNYVAALNLIDQRIADGSIAFDGAFLLELHGVLTAGLGREDDPHFKPHHEGAWRDGRALVVDRRTNTIMHEGPPAAEVPRQMESLMAWLSRRLDQGMEPPFVLSGVAHYAITDIHPFADGNGRVARLFQTAILMGTDVLPGRMFSFERYYAQDRAAYYDALRSVRRKTYNLEDWLQYFLAGLAEEYERVALTVAGLSTLLSAGGNEPLRLTVRQELALTTLRINGRLEFDRQDFTRAGGGSEGTATRELRQLVDHGVISVVGRGPTTRYRFHAAGVTGGAVDRRRSKSGAGRPKAWTDDRIEAELRAFLVDRTDWPTPKEFAEAGRRGLYLAASRSGGISRWRALVGR